MRPPCTAVLLLLALMAGPAADGQDAIHRCLDPTGRPVFTDRRCSTLDATPVQPTVAASVARPGTPRPADMAPQLCAADPAALRQQVLDAFARHEPNRLAGLMLWDDYGERGAVERIRALGALVDRPLLDLRDDDGGTGAWHAAAGPAASIYDASRPLRDQLDDPSPATPAAVSTDPRALIAITPGDDGAPRETRFAIERRAGCLWLQPPAG
ncbi:MAG: DUF4124 domain-containing protein [Xanthomonadaceae bacterium]|nr:DUF4124 domain-containing protein [Xanthomonadaceae bacterium]MDE1962535.1 DUF4124 domain-containing protein [Xanthomonadaceae bacterium]